MFESVDARMHARTDARTPARVPSYKLTVWAFGSGELKIGVLAIQKVAKTGNTEKKNSSGRQYRLCKIPQHAELSVTMRETTQD